jgi:hypothetical protein
VPIQEEGPLLNTYICLGENRNLGYRSQWDLKPRMTMLVRASSNLTDWPNGSSVMSKLWASCHPARTEYGNQGIFTVKSHYQAMTNEDI